MITSIGATSNRNLSSKTSEVSATKPSKMKGSSEETQAGNLEERSFVRVNEAIIEPGSSDFKIVKSKTTQPEVPEEFYGDHERYQEIFHDSRKIIKDPNKVYPQDKDV